MANKSKAKGNSFEREVASFLSNLYNESFTRVPNSGAFTGGKNAIRKEKLSENQIRSFKGDIIPPDDWKKFNCEAKSYAEFPFHQLLSQGKIGLLEAWTKQTLEAADPGDVNIIFMKFDRRGKYVAYQLPLSFDNHRFIDYTDETGNKWRITGFEDFFELNKDTFYQVCKGVTNACTTVL